MKKLIALALAFTFIGISSTTALAAPAKVDRITLEKAKEIVLTHAGLKAEDVTFTKTEYDWDDGISTYDLEFQTTNQGYDYEIKASDGTILKVEQEFGATTGAALTLEKAKEIALQHAGLTADKVSFIKGKLDHEDGISVYEIEFYAGGMEYEYEINAADGIILGFEKDFD